MRLEENVRYSYLVAQVGSLANMAGILVIAYLIPRPSEKVPTADPCDIVRWQIIAEAIALVR
jgi:hypothetical protein